jgi:hypothetical protein
MFGVANRAGRWKVFKSITVGHGAGNPRPEEEIKRLQNRAIERFSAGTLAGEFYEMVRRVYSADTKNL